MVRVHSYVKNKVRFVILDRENPQIDIPNHLPLINHEKVTGHLSDLNKVRVHSYVKNKVRFDILDPENAHVNSPNQITLIFHKKVTPGHW